MVGALLVSYSPLSCWAFAPLSTKTRSTLLPSVHLTTTVSNIPITFTRLHASSNEDDKDTNIDKLPSRRKSNKGSGKKRKKTSSRQRDPEATKKELVKAVGERMRQGKKKPSIKDDDEGLLNKLNPFKAGQSLRKTIDTAITSISSSTSHKEKSIYYMDDRFSNIVSSIEGALDRLEQDDYIPEVLVVGATGEVGRLVVKRLLLEGRFRVRVLVRDLYTKTLNMLGTGVTYCQGDLNNIDSLEFAVTDVDKIVFCSSPPRPDEEQFVQKFQEFMKENLDTHQTLDAKDEEANNKSTSDAEWEQLESVLEVRAQLAEQVDCVGLKNLVQAFQNVRHSDYGTSQAAKRSLFKFQGRPEDFNLFSLEEDEGIDTVSATTVESAKSSDYDDSYMIDDDDDYDYDDYMDKYDDDEDDYMEYDSSDIEQRRDASVKTQTQWLRNQFGHGVFVGRVPKGTEGSQGGEASVISSRLRSRQDPENGIDLGTGFAGFICRVCSDGGNYEAFVRTGSFYEDEIEYVCRFSTATKPVGRNKSKNKFVTVRLPFESFKPIQRVGTSLNDLASIPPFQGTDVRNIGFRYRAGNNAAKAKLEAGQWSSFYLALDYIKLYRSQPEPEFVFISDAQIPPIVRIDMVQHEAKQLVTGANGEASVRLLDESTLSRATRGRSAEEVYYKYRGEEILKNSGLNYAIARVAGFNEVQSAEASTIDLSPLNEDVEPVSRAEVAQVCVSALLDPSALNKSFYVTKKKSAVRPTDEDMKAKFKALPADVVA